MTHLSSFASSLRISALFGDSLIALSKCFFDSFHSPSIEKDYTVTVRELRERKEQRGRNKQMKKDVERERESKR